jgi:Na+/melibiose symporter-like transporter
MIFTFFVNGVSSAVRVSIGYCYFSEFAPKAKSDLMGTLWCVSDGSIYIWLTLYYRFISKDWKWTVAVAFVFELISFLGTWAILPESPQWLYSQKRYRECQKSLIFISQINETELPPNSSLF